MHTWEAVTKKAGGGNAVCFRHLHYKINDHPKAEY